MSRNSAHSSDVLPIVRLVREKVAGRGLRPFASERGIPYSTLRYYHNEQLKPLTALPRTETLRHLADGLRLSVDQVRRAALDSLEGRYVPEGSQPTMPAEEPGDATAALAAAIRNHPGLHPAAAAHLLNQMEILLLVPPDAQLPGVDELEQERRRQAAAVTAEARRRLEAVAQPDPPKRPKPKKKAPTSPAERQGERLR